MTTYTLTVTTVAFILAALLLREKFRRTGATEEVEVLREQFKDLRSIIENDRAEYVRAYNTMQKAGYTDKADLHDCSLSDDCPPYDHGIEAKAEAKSEGES